MDLVTHCCKATWETQLSCCRQPLLLLLVAINTSVAATQLAGAILHIGRCITVAIEEICASYQVS